MLHILYYCKGFDVRKCLNFDLNSWKSDITDSCLFIDFMNCIWTNFSGVHVTRSLVLYECFVDRCLSFCTFSFGHCVVCSSSIYRFWLSHWYLQTLLWRKKLSEKIFTYDLPYLCLSERDKVRKYWWDILILYVDACCR